MQAIKNTYHGTYWSFHKSFERAPLLFHTLRFLLGLLRVLHKGKVYMLNSKGINQILFGHFFNPLLYADKELLRVEIWSRELWGNKSDCIILDLGMSSFFYVHICNKFYPIYFPPLEKSDFYLPRSMRPPSV